MKSEQKGWHHPVDESDQWDGFNDPGIEMYAGSPIKHLAREAIQNSLDAGDDDCVYVQFILRSVDPSSIPNFQELKFNLNACSKSAENESKKASQFFDSAVKILDTSSIHVLEISDFNTKGMEGPCINTKPYYAFMKAKGQSRKDSSLAAGSYGIGKFAPYAVSQIRTIFVSTVFQHVSGEYSQYTQGKSILISHDVDGKRKHGVGFWGVVDRCQPVQGAPEGLPEWLVRTKNLNEMPSCKGSKLSILCFQCIENWQDFLAVSVAENFFGAIAASKLQVNIDNKHSLNQDTIQSFFEKENLQQIIQEQEDEPARFNRHKEYLKALQKDGDVFIEESEMAILGRCQLRIVVGEGLPRKICFLRNGMFITDRLNRLKQFHDFKEFTAVFQCLSDKGNELLREMEPPRHDNFEPERLQSKKEQKRGAKALKDVAAWVREMLKRHAKDPVEDVTEIDELREFFGVEGGSGNGKGDEEVNPYGKMTIRARPAKQKQQTPSRTGDIDVSGSEDGDEEGGGGSGGSGGGDGLGGTGPGQGGDGGGGESLHQTFIDNVRALPSGSKTRIIYFTPRTTGQVALRVQEAGADQDFNVSITGSNIGKAKDGKVFLKVESGKRVAATVNLSKTVSGAIKVTAYEIR